MNAETLAPARPPMCTDSALSPATCMGGVFGTRSVGGRPPVGFDERIHAYEIHVALSAVAYCAFRQRWDEVEAFAQTVTRLAAL